jgi:hypothetical protein
VYKLFVAQMEIQLAGQLRRERMAAELDATRTQLQALLVDPAICAAMTELLTFNAGAADCAVARTVIGNRATALLAAYDARRAFLLDRIAAYKAKP